MGSEMQEMIRAQAIEWHIRLRDGDDATWDAFAAWLAADSRHAEAYERIEQLDLAIEPLLPAMVFREAANDATDGEVDGAPQAPRHRRWLLAGGTLAASIALGLAVIPQFLSDRYEVVTEPGENQIVTLDATTRITLNGSTRMTFDRKNPRYASLAAGEALFHVRHDSARPFRLEVGDNLVEDAGTIFNVIREPGAVRVAVAEGKIVYNPGREAVALDAGKALIDQAASGEVRIAPVPVGSVGAWQRGQLVYAGEPLSQVAIDLSRSLGVRITVSPSLLDRPFHGTIALDGSGVEQLSRLKLALNVDLEVGPDGWMMKPLGRGGH
jgi:transmembrane sensor